MAGGSEWRLINKTDDADFYQKTDGGSWFQRKRVVYTIRTKITGASAPAGAGDQGTDSGILTFHIGGVTKTRSISDGRFVCKSDQVDDLGEAQNYVARTQVWVWESADEEEINFNA